MFSVEDTEAENHQSVEKQVLRVWSQCMFESEACVVVWEAVLYVYVCVSECVCVHLCMYMCMCVHARVAL